PARRSRCNLGGRPPMAPTTGIGLLVLLACALTASRGGAGNAVTWTAHVGEASVALPSGLFSGRVLPTAGTRWHCIADKLLRQDASGNTFSTLSVRCDDGETTVIASASCAIGGRDERQLSFELAERAGNVRNAIRAECAGGY
ncbi:MAG TPA: hypothetical protein VKU41_15350, partial [Polyangiaceae bacterium]|nr:hypothetical protein [Polyangiaceae bacterium]